MLEAQTMASNPVFSRLDKQMYARRLCRLRSGRGGRHRRPAPGVQDTVSPRQLEELYQRRPPARSRPAG